MSQEAQAVSRFAQERDAIVIADQPHARGVERLQPGTRVRLNIPREEIRLM